MLLEFERKREHVFERLSRAHGGTIDRQAALLNLAPDAQAEWRAGSWRGLNTAICRPCRIGSRRGRLRGLLSHSMTDIAVPDILAELDWRGLYADCTDRPALATRLAQGPITLYCGFDPTADSLHVGNLVPLLALRRFQLAGHHPLALAGGATGMIGDPSGKSDERTLATPAQLARHLECITPQLERFLDFSTRVNPARVVNNYDWTAPLSILEFLRDVGKHISVNSMVAKESVRARMEDRAAGISFTEFSYMLLQGFDFYTLRQTHGCELQIGATDQWGNITVGTELTRKKLGATVWGVVFPLLTKADGTKYGKTATGTVWLDRAKTSPYRFYQFFMNTSDADVAGLLKTLTFLPAEAIAELEGETENAAGSARRAASTGPRDDDARAWRGRDGRRRECERHPVWRTGVECVRRHVRRGCRRNTDVGYRAHRTWMAPARRSSISPSARASHRRRDKPGRISRRAACI